MIIEKNMNIKMEVTPEIVIEFFKEATYDEIMTAYNGMPREVRSEIASHFLSDLASTDMNEYRRFIGDSKPEYSESVREPETTKTPETPKDTSDTKSSKSDSEEEFKVGDVYRYGDYERTTLEIIEVSDKYVKIKQYIADPLIELIYGKFMSTQNTDKVGNIRKDVLRYMLKAGLITKVK